MRITVLVAGLIVLAADAAVAADTGSIQATINSPYARRSEGVVYIEKVEGEFKPSGDNPLMDQKKLVFIPYVLPVLVGSTVDFPNNDVVRHNVFAPKSSVETFNLGTYAAGVTKRRTFNQVGVVKLLCNVHAEMSAFIIVCQNPYFAVTDKKTGSGTIENVPAGTYTVTFWHGRLKSKTAEVTVEAGETAEVKFSSLSRKR